MGFIQEQELRQAFMEISDKLNQMITLLNQIASRLNNIR